MSRDLSESTEQYLASVVAGRLYPSKEAALEAAVAALREKSRQVPLVPDEHLELVEQAVASSLAGRSRALTAADWANLRQNARDAASGRTRS
jgi:hypothetical protein